MSETLSQSPAQNTATPSSPAPQRQTISVLLVGSDAQSSGILELLRKHEDIGFEVRSAQEADSASQTLEGRGFDLVLIDDTIEPERRLELVKSITSSPSNPPVIVLCRSAEGDLAERARAAGSCDTVRKDSTAYLTLGRTVHNALLSRQPEDGPRDQPDNLTVFDALTGLHNNGYFLESLEGECSRASRYGSPFSVLMLDIDDFAAHSDRYDRPACDELLKRVADLLRRGVRQADLVSRGDAGRFCLLLPETDFDGAMCLGERLRFEVAARRLAPTDRAEPITISVGVCSPPRVEHLRARHVTLRCEDALREAIEKGNTVAGRHMRLPRAVDEAEAG